MIKHPALIDAAPDKNGHRLASRFDNDDRPRERQTNLSAGHAEFPAGRKRCENHRDDHCGIWALNEPLQFTHSCISDLGCERAQARSTQSGWIGAPRAAAIIQPLLAGLNVGSAAVNCLWRPRQDAADLAC